MGNKVKGEKGKRERERASERERKSLLWEAVYLLLESQFVVIPTRADALYRCMEGSGIGLSHSCFITNLAFYYEVELPYIIPAITNNSILGYARYHDDAIAVSSDNTGMVDFGHVFRHKLSYFSGKCTDYSASSVQVLDLQVQLEANTIVCSPLLVKSPIPLCPTSAHAPHVHTAWPRAVKDRVLSLSGDPIEAETRLMQQYKSVPAHPLVFSRLASKKTSKQTKTHEAADRIACIIKYHPVLKRALASALREHPVPKQLDFSIFTGWRNALPSLATYSNYHNKAMV